MSEPILVRMLMRASSDGDNASRTAKELFSRPRPFLVEDGPICIPRADWLVGQGSYPSGHSATGWIWAMILSELAPGRAEAVVSRGRAYGESRVVCGVHYVTDIEAGRAVADATLSRLRSDPTFQSDMKAARAELERAMSSGPKPIACDVQSELDSIAY
jgi:acid phosphatase (class A)